MEILMATELKLEAYLNTQKQFILNLKTYYLERLTKMGNLVLKLVVLRRLPT